MDKKYQKMSAARENAGFTLIELLVVVLIVGILAAAALPQYQKAVERSIAGKMMESVRALNDAQKRYYMANGEMAFSFDELDVRWGLPEVPAGASESKGCSKSVGSPSSTADGSVLDAGDYELQIADVYGLAYSFAWRKGACGAVYSAPQAYAFSPNLSDTNSFYCYSGVYIGDAKDWCSKTFGTRAEKDHVPVPFSGSTVRLPF